MKLKKLSDKALNVLYAGVSVIPAYAIGKYFVDFYKVKKAYASNEMELARLQDIADSMPETAEQYDAFIKSGDPDAVKVYQGVYTDLKKDGITDDFYKKNGFKDEREFWNQVDDYYQAGVDGNLEAQEGFNNLLGSYNNAIYEQASGEASKIFLDTASCATMPSMELGGLDFITADLGKSTVCVLCAGIVGLCAADIYLRHKKNKLKKHANVREQIVSQVRSDDLMDELFPTTTHDTSKDKEREELRKKMENEKSTSYGNGNGDVMVPDSFADLELRRKKHQLSSTRFLGR